MQSVSASPGNRFPESIEQPLKLGHALAKLGELFPVLLDVTAEPGKQRDVQDREGDPGSNDGIGVGGHRLKLWIYLLLGTYQ